MSNHIFSYFAHGVVDAMNALTHGWGSSPMHSDLHSLYSLREKLEKAYLTIPSPSPNDKKNLSGALSHIDGAIKMHKDDKSPCCRNCVDTKTNNT